LESSRAWDDDEGDGYLGNRVSSLVKRATVDDAVDPSFERRGQAPVVHGCWNDDGVSIDELVGELVCEGECTLLFWCMKCLVRAPGLDGIVVKMWNWLNFAGDDAMGGMSGQKGLRKLWKHKAGPRFGATLPKCSCQIIQPCALKTKNVVETDVAFKEIHTGPLTWLTAISNM
jgi:hypothetical protein